MMIDSFVRADILEMVEYEPVIPLEVLSEELGIPVAHLVKLDANENPYGTPPAVRRAMAECEVLHIYPDPMQNRLRDALAAHLGLPRENILAGAGADELIDLVMRLVLTPGEAIVNCPPTFGMYPFDADLHGARTILVPRDEAFRLDLAGIGQAVEREAPRLLFVTSPNNPDGGLITADELAQLLALPVLVVLDEAYVEFCGRSFAGWVLRHDNLIVLRTFSKWAGLAGVRVGYGIFPSALMPHLWKIKQPYNVSVPAQVAAMAALGAADELMGTVRAIIEERERLQAGLRAIDWLHAYPSHSNFVLCRVHGRSAWDVKLALRRQGILVRYFDKPGVADCLRFSVGRPEQTGLLLDALRRL